MRVVDYGFWDCFLLACERIVMILLIVLGCKIFFGQQKIFLAFAELTSAGQT